MSKKLGLNYFPRHCLSSPSVQFGQTALYLYAPHVFNIRIDFCFQTLD